MSTQKFATQALHAGHNVSENGGTRAVPIYQSTAYVFNNSDHAANLFALTESGNIYSRINNPTNDIVLIESDIKGGSMHAIKWAKKLNKRIWCFDMNASGNKEILNNYDNVIKFSNIDEFINKFNIKL